MSAKDNFKIALREIFLTKPANSTEKPDISVEYSKRTAVYDFFDADTSVFAACSRIEGNVYSGGHIRVNGSVKGSITAKGNVFAKGFIDGDISCNAVCFTVCEVHGNISAVTDLKIESGSVIHGDLASKNLFCSGEVHGDFFISGHVHLSETALVYGNIRSKSITMAKGAVFSGKLEAADTYLKSSD